MMIARAMQQLDGGTFQQTASNDLHSLPSARPLLSTTITRRSPWYSSSSTLENTVADKPLEHGCHGVDMYTHVYIYV